MKHKTYKFYGYGSFTSKLKQLALPRWYCLLSGMFWKLWTRINLWQAFSKKSMEKLRKKSARSCSAIKKLCWKISYNSEYLWKQLSFSLVLKAAGFRPFNFVESITLWDSGTGVSVWILKILSEVFLWYTRWRVAFPQPAIIKNNRELFLATTFLYMVRVR